MGACETTPPTSHAPGKPSQRPPYNTSTSGKGSSSLLIIGRRLPASSSFVLARACRRGAAGASSLTPVRATAENRSDEEKPHHSPRPAWRPRAKATG